MDLPPVSVIANTLRDGRLGRNCIELALQTIIFGPQDRELVVHRRERISDLGLCEPRSDVLRAIPIESLDCDEMSVSLRSFGIIAGNPVTKSNEQ
jgi:hypothetical protein